MKPTLTLAAFLLFTTTFAQNPLVLNETNVPTHPDTLVYSRAVVTGVQPATEGAAQTWDFSSLTDLPSSDSYIMAEANTPNFPNAQLSLLVFEAMAAGASIEYYLRYEVDSVSNRIVGFDVYEQRYGLLGVVPGAQATDSFIVPAQYLVYNEPQVVHDFPATEGGSWRSHIVRTYDAYLTFAAVSFNNVLITKKVYEERHDTVAGWGKLRVPNYGSGGPSADYDVLMIQRVRTITDSIYINDVLADSATLAMFQLEQGKTSSHYRTLFYRPYHHQPLMNYYSSDSTFSDVISLSYDRDTEPYTGMEDAIASANARVFPNPITENIMHLLVATEKTDRLNVHVFDLAGRLVSQTTCTATAGASSHVITMNPEHGTYLIDVRNADGKTLHRQLVVK